MAPGRSSDPRRVVGALVNTLATAVTHMSKCKRLYGSAARTKRVNGIVKKVIVNQPPTGRASWHLEVLWTLTPIETKLLVSNTNRIKHGHINDTVELSQDTFATDFAGLASQNSHTDDDLSASQHETVTIHDVNWVRENVTTPMNGVTTRKLWILKMQDGNQLVQAGGFRSYRIVDIFISLFPMHHMTNIVSWTSDKLHNISEAITSQTEILKFFGLLILLTRFEFHNRRDLWSSTRTSKYIPAPNLSETRMSRHRFDNLLRCITFSYCPDSPGDLPSAEYRWRLVDDFVHAFNFHRKLRFEPSENICVDESFSRWYGHGGAWIDKGLPHYVSLERKPEAGCEIQNSACGESGVLLKLKLVKAISEDSHTLSDNLQHGTSILCELVEPWNNTNRIVCADSYFASVHTAEVLIEKGLKFIGVVKNCTRKFPLSYLSSVEATGRFQHVSMVRRNEDYAFEMSAVMWIDRDRRYFISTASSVEPGEPHGRKRWRQTEEGANPVTITITPPKLIDLYYSVCGKIDRHNRCRQADLNIEKKVQTKSWAFRVNSTILSMVAVDSWLVYQGCHGSDSHMTQGEFYESLATELIDLDYEPSSQPATESISLMRIPSKRGQRTSNSRNHVAQRRCKVCSKKTTHMCAQCKIQDRTSVYLCDGSTGRTCFEEHKSEIHVFSSQ